MRDFPVRIDIRLNTGQYKTFTLKDFQPSEAHEDWRDDAGQSVQEHASEIYDALLEFAAQIEFMEKR